MLPKTTDDLFLSCLSPAGLINFSHTCKSAQETVQAYIRRAFDLNRVLSPFFTPLEIQNFRYYQSKTEMFISGSTALQFFDRNSYLYSDLDIYVEYRYRESIAVWLESIGYEFKPRRGNDNTLAEELQSRWGVDPDVTPWKPFVESSSTGYFGRGVANVYNFFKYNPERKIQLITSNHAPLEVVLNFHSTCVMNIITHTKAYSLYPKATFEERRSLMISTEGSNQNTARKKYVSRGWTMVERLTPTEVINPQSSFATGNRYIGDSKCWTIPIYPRVDLPEGFIETNTWALKYNVEQIPNMDFRILRTDCLNFSYLVVDMTLEGYIWPAIYPAEERKKNIDRDILQLIRWRRMFSGQ